MSRYNFNDMEDTKRCQNSNQNNSQNSSQNSTSNTAQNKTTHKNKKNTTYTKTTKKFHYIFYNLINI